LVCEAAYCRRQEPVAGSGRDQLAAGRYDEALANLEQAHREAPASSAAAADYAMALEAVGRYAEALGILQPAIEAGRAAAVGAQYGRLLILRGRRLEAEDVLRATIAARGTAEMPARAELGVLLLDRGRHEEADEILYSLIDAYNARTNLTAADLVAVGEACRVLGRHDAQLFKDALRAFDEALVAAPDDLDARVAIGTLFLEKYDSGEARTSLVEVLERNAKHPEALLAMAQVLRFDGDSEARDLVEQALAVNPSLAGARILRAQLLLELEQHQEAADEAQRVLEGDPENSDAIAVLAAANYLMGEQSEFERLRTQALAINPHNARFYVLLSEACVQNRLYEEARNAAREAVALDPQAWSAWGELGLNQLRQGEMAEGRRSLEAAFKGDPYNVWIKNTLDLLDKLDQFEVTHTPRFEIAAHGDEAELIVPYVGHVAERAYDYLADRYRVEPRTPIRIEVYPSHEDFSVRTVGLTGLGALGVSFGPVVAIDSPSGRTIGEFNWGTTLWHEIAHTFTLTATDFKIPRWLTEGLSVYEERGGPTGWADDVTPDFLQAYHSGMLLGLGEFNDGFVRPRFPNQIGLSYYQASLVCELIETEWGFERLLAVLAGYRRGLTTEEVFSEVFDLTLEAFDARFWSYLDARFQDPLKAFPKVTSQTREVDAEVEGEEDDEGDEGDGIEELSVASFVAMGAAEQDPSSWVAAEPDNFRAQYARGSQLLERGEAREAVEYLQRAKALFPDLALEESAYHLLARAYRQLGERELEIAELAALTGINEYDYPSHLELARLYAEDGRYHDQADILERLMYIFPMHVEPHQDLAAAYARIGDTRGVVRERRAVVALRPPNLAEARYQLALALRDAGSTREAKSAVLGALELAPGYAEAQDLLLELVSEGAGA
jgi:tetratricopeptide (TPR) repeat protein